MTHHLDIDDLILNYDPASPQERFRAAGLEAATAAGSERMPVPVPWPHSPPTAAPLDPAPAETDDLSRFAGYDAVVVTWTAAEAAALAALMTPDHPTSEWYEYRHDVESYLPLVTGKKAPFNDKRPDQARYYHSLGLYFPCTIGDARVLLFKSGLHMAYDGPQVPVRKLMTEIVQAIRPKLFITTGTGGGIGKDMALGDVIIAGLARFDCQAQFKSEPWAHASYATSRVPSKAVASITPALTRVNAARLPGGAGPGPTIWHSRTSAVVTTDFFAFDDSTDHYKLQGLGQVCDMGDAMVGAALAASKGVRWFSIRNASDPQISNPTNDIRAANHQAGEIYTKYGPFTTAASVIATWALIDAGCNSSR